jgi:hypothetical protein
MDGLSEENDNQSRSFAVAVRSFVSLGEAVRCCADAIWRCQTST